MVKVRAERCPARAVLVFGTRRSRQSADRKSERREQRKVLAFSRRYILMQPRAVPESYRWICGSSKREMSNESGCPVHKQLEGGQACLSESSIQWIAMVGAAANKGMDEGCKDSGGNRSSDGSEVPQIIAAWAHQMQEMLGEWWSAIKGHTQVMDTG